MPSADRQFLIGLARVLRGDLLLGVDTATLCPRDPADLQAALRYVYAEAQSGLPVPRLGAGGLVVDYRHMDGAVAAGEGWTEFRPGHRFAGPQGPLTVAEALDQAAPGLRLRVERLRLVLANGDEVAFERLHPSQREARRHRPGLEGKAYQAAEGDLLPLLLSRPSCFGLLTEVRFRLQAEPSLGQYGEDELRRLKRALDPYGFLTPLP